MNHTTTLLALVVIILIGCGKKENSTRPSNPSAPVVTAKPINVESSQPADAAPVPPPQDAPAIPAALTDTDILGGKGRPLTDQEKMLFSYGVEQFKEAKGRFPSSLDEAVKAGFIARIPELPAGQKLSYDPSKGTVTITGDK